MSDAILDALRAAVRVEAEKIVADEANEAAKRIHDRMRLLAPHFAMSIMNHYDVARDAERVIITVRQGNAE
ncbi:hypothetical protein [Sphingomonas alpina]|uniref:Uncharacterized protein n=1 Tax=Sphingomonas alpina TaxID=653931 RepID=A0A7H0LHX9_9SPHN|nr:hypothetical protein [Sphingomonas alpina]QNQ09282.1 hypothetical protein H3Z74_21850 [Sphingomonas alpina]